MTIEIHQPELEALIHSQMQSGQFSSVEELLLQALEAAPLPCAALTQAPQRTGSDLIAAMQAMPYKDDVNFEYSRSRMPIRDVEF